MNAAQDVKTAETKVPAMVFDGESLHEETPDEAIKRLKAECARWEEKHSHCNAELVEAQRKLNQALLVLYRFRSQSMEDWHPVPLSTFTDTYVESWVTYLRKIEQEWSTMKHVLHHAKREVANAIAREGWFAENFPSALRQRLWKISTTLAGVRE